MRVSGGCGSLQPAVQTLVWTAEKEKLSHILFCTLLSWSTFPLWKTKTKVLTGKYLAAAAHIPVGMAGSEGRNLSGGLECVGKSNACKTWVVRRIETSRATLTGAAEEDLRDSWL